jgi:hypothetical protein
MCFLAICVPSLTESFFYLFSGTRVWTEVLVLARQTLYDLIHASSPVCLLWRHNVFKTFSDFTYLFFLVLWFELRASCLLGRCSCTWAVPPARFSLEIFWIGSHVFLSQLPCTTVLPIFVSRVARIYRYVPLCLIWFLFLLLEVGFELRASHFLGGYSTVWATPTALFTLVTFETGSHFLPIPTWTVILLCYTSCHSHSWGNRHVPLRPTTGWDGGLENFCVGWSWPFQCEPPK